MMERVRVWCRKRDGFSLAPALLSLWCCSADVGVTLVKPPPEAPAPLVVGDIEATDPEARRLARFMRVALLDRLLQSQTFTVVYDREAKGAGEKALLLEGVVTQADPGSEALRFLIGSGFGRPRLTANFRLLDRDGAARAAFSVASDDPGPTGLSGHWRPLSMEDLAQDLGRSAGEAVVRWSEGNDLDAGAIF
jgi:hypothetical protein